MDLKDAITLVDDNSIRSQKSTVWADLGSGSGLFSYALANLLKPGSMIYAIDKFKTKLTTHQNPYNIVIEQKQLDFISDELQLSELGGILMANSLHFVENKIPLINKLSRSLKEDCGFLIIEYNTDSPNPWVPFPVSLSSLHELFEAAGYHHIRKIHEKPSAFGRSTIYSAIINK